MQKKFWLIFFVVVFICELVGVRLKNELLQLIFKPLIVPAIAGYFFTQLNIAGSMPKWILLALFFSFAGDVLLMFQAKDQLFFLLGLSAFLIAHIFYIIFFYKIKIKEQVKSSILFLLIAAIYYAALISWLFPYLGQMKMPVCVYGIIISIMFLLAMHLLSIKNKAAGTKIFLGALLFVTSDSILAINKFYQPFEIANVIIMLTYGLAQYCIIHGAVKYINQIKR
jgi:uncharacterized membrane protein YhhN